MQVYAGPEVGDRPFGAQRHGAEVMETTTGYTLEGDFDTDHVFLDTVAFGRLLGPTAFNTPNEP